MFDIVSNILLTILCLLIAGIFWVMPEMDRFRYENKWMIKIFSWSAMFFMILVSIALWF